MGTYYNPVSDITDGQVGRRITASTHADAMRQVRTDQGEHLYALCDRLIFKQAVCVDDAGEYKEFYDQYMAGGLISFQLVVLNADDHAKALAR